MKYVKMLLVMIISTVIGLISYQNFKPESKALPSKKVVKPIQTAFNSCMEKADTKKEMYENSLQLMVAHANLMNSVEYVAEHHPTDKDLKILKHREEVFQQVEHKVHLRNRAITEACSLERQLPEIAAN